MSLGQKLCVVLCKVLRQQIKMQMCVKKVFLLLRVQKLWPPKQCSIEFSSLSILHRNVATSIQDVFVKRRCARWQPSPIEAKISGLYFDPVRHPRGT